MPFKVSVDQEARAYRFDATALMAFDNVASIGAGVANTTVQARLALPANMKIPKVAVNYSASSSTIGSNQFNIVVGNGSYSSGGAKATQTVVIGGTATTGDTFNVIINGHTVATAQTTGNTNIQDATAAVTNINADTTANKIVVASNASGTSATITLTALTNGTWANTITVAGSTNGGETATPGGATLTGGINTGVTTVVPDDTTAYTGPIATGIPGGFPVPTYAAAGEAMFSQDQSIVTAADTPQILIPTNYDGVYPMGTLLTLRAVTGATNGSITNFKVSFIGVVINPYTNVAPGYQQQLWSVPTTSTATKGW